LLIERMSEWRKQTVVRMSGRFTPHGAS
jgi:hypothetical protein